MRKYVLTCAITFLVLAGAASVEADIVIEKATNPYCLHAGETQITYFSAIMYYDALSKTNQLLDLSGSNVENRDKVIYLNGLLRMHLFAKYAKQWGRVMQHKTMSSIEEDQSEAVDVNYCQALNLHFIFSGLDIIEPKLVSGQLLRFSETAELLGLAEEHRALSSFLGLPPSSLYDKALKSLAVQLKVGNISPELKDRARTFLLSEALQSRR